MSRRATESRGEKALGVFLDKYFYEKAREQRLITYFERIYAINEQKKGVNVLIGESQKIDEKAQLYYINRPVDSFAFEIDYFDERENGIVDGWFVSNSNETDEYLLMWIQEARTSHVNRLVAEDFEIVEADLIKKAHLKAYIEKLGISDKVLKKKAIEMRDKKTQRYDFNEECHITYSAKGFSDAPINLVIKKSVLDKLSEERFLITKDEVKKL